MRALLRDYCSRRSSHDHQGTANCSVSVHDAADIRENDSWMSGAPGHPHSATVCIESAHMQVQTFTATSPPSPEGGGDEAGEGGAAQHRGPLRGARLPQQLLDLRDSAQYRRDHEPRAETQHTAHVSASRSSSLVCGTQFETWLSPDRHDRHTRLDSRRPPAASWLCGT